MSENEKNLDEKKLRRLLRLKRYEVPPPGFFRELRSGIMEEVEIFHQRPHRNTGFLNQLFSLKLHPVLSGAFAVCACALLAAPFMVGRGLQNSREAELISLPKFRLAKEGGESGTTNLAAVTALTNQASPAALMNTNNPFQTPDLKVERVGF